MSLVSKKRPLAFFKKALLLSVLLAPVTLSALNCGAPESGTPSDDGEVVSKPIGLQGGELSVPGGGTMKIPAGALPKETVITIRQTKSLPPLPQGFKPLGPAYEFGPDGLHFEKAITIEVPHTTSSSTKLQFFSIPTGGAWEQVPGASKGADVFEAKLEHFSGGQLGEGVPAGDDGGVSEPDGGTTSSSASSSSASSSSSSGGGTGGAGGFSGAGGGGGVVCQAGMLMCGGTCINPLNDPNNCGGCGKKCASGICSSANCE